MSVSTNDIQVRVFYDEQEKAFYAQNPLTGEYERCTIIEDDTEIDPTRGDVISVPAIPVPTQQPQHTPLYTKPALSPIPYSVTPNGYMLSDNDKIHTSAHICEPIYSPRVSGKTVGIGFLIVAVFFILLIPTFGHTSTASAIHIQLKKMPQNTISKQIASKTVLPAMPSPSIVTPVPLRIVPLGDSSVVGNPTISVDFINRVLTAYHSPAAGLGQEIYDDGVAVNIDPGFALAFFMHESSFGKEGEAVSSLNPGNLRCIPGIPCRDNFAWFSSWHAGFKAWYHLIRYGYVNGAVSSLCPCVTVAQIIPVYAPPVDHNNDDAYIAAILHAMATWRSGQIYVS